MNIKTYVEGDFNQLEQLSISELRGVLRAMNAAANKRIARIEKAGVADYSAALADRNWERFKTKTSPEKMQVLAQIAEVRAFLRRTKGELARARKSKEEAETVFDFVDDIWPSGLSWKELMDWVYNGSPVEGDALALGSQKVSQICYREAQGAGSTANVAQAIRAAVNQMMEERAEYDRVAAQFDASGNGTAGARLYSAASDEMSF